MLLLSDDLAPALWSVCERARWDATAPADVRCAADALARELVGVGRLPEAARRERDDAGRAVYAARSSATTRGPWRAWRLSRRVSLLVEPRDLWCGVYWNRGASGLVVFVGVPCLVLRVEVG